MGSPPRLGLDTVASADARASIGTHMTTADLGLTPRERAAAWLRERLAAGSVPSSVVLTEAVVAGFAPATLRQAKRDIRVRAVRVGFGREGEWSWQLPPTSEQVAALTAKLALRAASCLITRS